MSNADVSEAARSLAAARWGDRVLVRSAGVVLERAELSDVARAELEQIAEQGEEHG
jgi:hypothetical protein